MIQLLMLLLIPGVLCRPADDPALAAAPETPSGDSSNETAVILLSDTGSRNASARYSFTKYGVDNDTLANMSPDEISAFSVVMKLFVNDSMNAQEKMEYLLSVLNISDDASTNSELKVLNMTLCFADNIHEEKRKLAPELQKVVNTILNNMTDFSFIRQDPEVIEAYMNDTTKDLTPEQKEALDDFDKTVESDLKKCGMDLNWNGDDNNNSTEAKDPEAKDPGDKDSAEDKMAMNVKKEDGEAVKEDSNSTATEPLTGSDDGKNSTEIEPTSDEKDDKDGEAQKLAEDRMVMNVEKDDGGAFKKDSNSTATEPLLKSDDGKNSTEVEKDKSDEKEDKDGGEKNEKDSVETHKDKNSEELVKAGGDKKADTKLKRAAVEEEHNCTTPASNDEDSAEQQEPNGTQDKKKKLKRHVEHNEPNGKPHEVPVNGEEHHEHHHHNKTETKLKRAAIEGELNSTTSSNEEDDSAEQPEPTGTEEKKKLKRHVEHNEPNGKPHEIPVNGEEHHKHHHHNKTTETKPKREVMEESVNNSTYPTYEDEDSAEQTKPTGTEEKKKKLKRHIENDEPRGEQLRERLEQHRHHNKKVAKQWKIDELTQTHLEQLERE